MSAWSSSFSFFSCSSRSAAFSNFFFAFSSSSPILESATTVGSAVTVFSTTTSLTTSTFLGPFLSCSLTCANCCFNASSASWDCLSSFSKARTRSVNFLEASLSLAAESSTLALGVFLSTSTNSSREETARSRIGCGCPPEAGDAGLDGDPLRPSKRLSSATEDIIRSATLSTTSLRRLNCAKFSAPELSTGWPSKTCSRDCNCSARERSASARSRASLARACSADMSDSMRLSVPCISSFFFRNSSNSLASAGSMVSTGGATKRDAKSSFMVAWSSSTISLEPWSLDCRAA
mmetsp:Transcript_79357/g.160882  ORF Transcript_79357/g.160882 Transcript_79357/m.160882 type:complete len:292 (+) Transcript_79357:171-1046(+)